MVQVLRHAQGELGALDIVERQPGPEEQVVLEGVGRALRSPPVPVPLRQQGEFGFGVEDGIQRVLAADYPGAVIVLLDQTVARAEAADGLQLEQPGPGGELRVQPELADFLIVGAKAVG